MYVGTVLTFVGGGVRALSTLPGLNQQMSQVGHIDRLGFGIDLGLEFGQGLGRVQQALCLNIEGAY